MFYSFDLLLLVKCRKMLNNVDVCLPVKRLNFIYQPEKKYLIEVCVF